MREIVLRYYQDETIERLIENYENNINRQLCVLATGTGKTIIATEFCQKFKPNEPKLFIVNRIDLAYQAQEEFLDSDPTLNVGIEMNDHHASENDDIVIASIDTIGRRGSYRIGKFEPDHFSVVIVDEAHFSVSDIYERVLNYLEVGPDNLNKDKLLVGLTATPERSDNLSLGHIYDTITIDYNIKKAIDDGYLTDIATFQIDTGIDISDPSLHTRTDFKTELLDEKINVYRRNELVVDSYEKLSSGEPAIVFSNSVDHAYELKKVFNGRGITAEVIEAHTKKSDRKKWIEDYKKGKIKVLINYGTLTYGFNAPETSTIILARPIKFIGLLKQIIGRGLRPSEYSFINHVRTPEGRRQAIENSIKPYCKVVDIHDSVGEQDIIGVPSLFGLNPKLQEDTEGKPIFKEVVEPLEEVKKERSINLQEIESLEEVEMLISKRKVKLETLETPDEISRHSTKDWSQVGEEKYEIIYSQDKKSLIIEKNALDKYEVILQDAKSNNAKKLNEFYDLSGAVKLADDYADRYLDTSFVEEAPWMKGGVTRPQFGLLKKIYKGRIGVSKSSTYEDTGVPKLYDRQLREPIVNAKQASKLISDKLGK